METESMRIKNILLVEHDPRVSELILTALEQNHLAHRVAIVDNGADALHYLYQRGKFKKRAGSHPVLVLLDLKMPKVSGLDVLKIIKAGESLKIIPVVIHSSSRKTPDLVERYKHFGKKNAQHEIPTAHPPLGG
jgi:CheY-like chemotaxis protein